MIEFRQVHFGVFSMSRFAPPALNSDWILLLKYNIGDFWVFPPNWLFRSRCNLSVEFCCLPKGLDGRADSEDKMPKTNNRHTTRVSADKMSYRTSGKNLVADQPPLRLKRSKICRVNKSHVYLYRPTFLTFEIAPLICWTNWNEKKGRG